MYWKAFVERKSINFPFLCYLFVGQRVSIKEAVPLALVV